MDTKKGQLTGPIVKVRKIVKHGNSFYISIPRPFIELHGLQAGEKVPVVCDHLLKVIPMKEE